MDALEYINNAISLISAGMDHQEQMDLTAANAMGTMSEGERLRTQTVARSARCSPHPTCRTRQQLRAA